MANEFFEKDSEYNKYMALPPPEKELAPGNQHWYNARRAIEFFKNKSSSNYVSPGALEKIRAKNSGIDRVDEEEVYKIYGKDPMNTSLRFNRMFKDGGAENIVFYKGIAFDAGTGERIEMGTKSLDRELPAILHEGAFETNLEEAKDKAGQITQKRDELTGKVTDMVEGEKAKGALSERKYGLNTADDAKMKGIMARRDAAVGKLQGDVANWQSTMYAKLGQQAAMRDVLGVDQNGNPSFATGAFVEKMKQNISNSAQAATQEANAFRTTELGGISQGMSWDSFVQNDRVKSAIQDHKMYQDALNNLMSSYKIDIQKLSIEGSRAMMSAQESLKQYEVLKNEALASQAQDYAMISSIFDTLGDAAKVMVASKAGGKAGTGGSSLTTTPIGEGSIAPSGSYDIDSDLA